MPPVKGPVHVLLSLVKSLYVPLSLKLYCVDKTANNNVFVL